MYRRGQRLGFTLIELLVVIGIITVLAGLVYMIGPVLQRNQAASSQNPQDRSIHYQFILLKRMGSVSTK